jgi:hypothetical protein
LTANDLVEKQEDNPVGQLEKTLDIIYTCENEINAGTISDIVKEDCIKVVGELASKMSKVLRDNRECRQHIIWLSRGRTMNPKIEIIKALSYISRVAGVRHVSNEITIIQL